MNVCNFAKVIIARCSKRASTYVNGNSSDSSDSENIGIPTPNFAGAEENDEEEGKKKKRYNSSATMSERFCHYENTVRGYPKMMMSSCEFRILAPRIEKIFRESRHWKCKNKGWAADKQHFIHYFSGRKWLKLSTPERSKHKLKDCLACHSISHEKTSSLLIHSHRSKHPLQSITDKITNIIKDQPDTSNKECGIQVAGKIVNKGIEPTFKKTYGLSFIEALTKSSDIAKTSKSEKLAYLKEKMKGMEVQWRGENGEDAIRLLGSGESFAAYERRRKSMYFENREEAKRRFLEKQPISRPINFNSYKFDKEAYLVEIKRQQPGSDVCWTEWAKDKYPVISPTMDISPKGGQILKEYARCNGIDVNSFNPMKTVSGRDISQRIRVAKKRIPGTNISMPNERSALDLKHEAARLLEAGELDIGEMVVPKAFEKSVINTTTGKMEKVRVTVFGRKFSLMKIRQNELKRQEKKGILRVYPDVYYEDTDGIEIKRQLELLGEKVSHDESVNRDYLKDIHRTRHMKFWHDHSGILDHSHYLMMYTWIYDKANYLDDEEYRQKNPQEKDFSVQEFVERPSLYVFGRSAASDADQLLYCETRREDLVLLDEPVLSVEKVAFKDRLRFFSGDEPARDFECGQKHLRALCGVTAKDYTSLQTCYRAVALTLKERQTLFLGGSLWLRYESGTINPFANLKKSEIQAELRSRGVNYDENANKPELEAALNEILQGMQRIPAVLGHNVTELLQDINCEIYGIVEFEGLHDVSNVIQHLIEELPYITTGQTSNDLKDFIASTKGSKQHVKGCDARLMIISTSLI